MSAAESAQWVADVATADRALEREIALSWPGDTYRDVTERALDGLEREPDALDPERIDDIREFFRHRVEEQCGAWIGDLDAHGLDEDAITGDEVVFPRGYDEIPHRIAAGLDVRLGQVVHRVNLVRGRRARGDRRTVLRGPEADRHGAAGRAEGRRDRCSTRRCRSARAGPIARLGMGVFNKVFLQFPERFWEDGVYAIRALGEAGEHWHSWYDVSAISGRPTLLTFAAGPFGRHVQELDDAEIVADVVAALRDLYGADVPEPSAHWITRWGQDRFSHGSYSYVAAGSSHHDHDALADPIGGVLHLAGEATWGTEPATVGGAYASGVRAAERILGRPVDLAALADGILRREARRRDTTSTSSG